MQYLAVEAGEVSGRLIMPNTYIQYATIAQRVLVVENEPFFQVTHCISHTNEMFLHSNGFQDAVAAAQCAPIAGVYGFSTDKTIERMSVLHLRNTHVFE